LARAFWHEALHRRPGFDQRAIDREMVVAQKSLNPRLRQPSGKELRRDVAVEQPIAVL
jgi:hypothetical protein